MKKQVAKKKPAPRSAFDTNALWLVLLLILVTLAVYAPLRHYDFVSFEDSLYVTENDRLSGGLTWPNVLWALTTDRSGYWVPLTWLSHLTDRHLHGLAAGPQHVTNVLLHIVNSLLLFVVLRRMTGGLYESALAAGLFAVHPLHVESVAWIAQRKDVLSALFWMLTIWAYAVYAGRPTRARYALVVVAFAFGLMAKPILVTLPFVLLLLDVWPLRRVRLQAGEGSVWLRLAGEKLPLLIMAGASSVVTLMFSSKHGSVGSLDAYPVALRIGNALVSYAAYIRDTFWPANLAAFYPYESLSGLEVAVSVVALAAGSVLVAWKARVHTYLAVGWLWYLGTLTPVSGLVQSGTQSRADRFTYLPVIGLFIMAAWGIPHLFGRWRHRAIAFPVIVAILVCVSAAAAGRQVRYWENSFTLWERALQVTDGNHVAHNVLGIAMADGGRLDEAIGHYNKALSIRPDDAESHNNLGIALAQQGRMDEAVFQFRTAAGMPSPTPDMYYNLGFALAQQGNAEQAIAEYDNALRVDPGYVAAHTKAGDALFLQGKLREAIARYREALHIQPGYALAHTNLGVALASQQQYEEAIMHYNAALRLQPDLADAHNGLGATFANMGRFGQAIRHFTDALRIQPGYANARANLARVLEMQQAQAAAGP